MANTISVQQALTELKTLDSRIKKTIQEGKFVGVKIGQRPVKGYASDQEFENAVQASFHKVNDLINRRNELKSKVVESNAVTKVTVGEQEMTVAEAIERKNAIDYEKSYLSVLKRQFQVAHDFYNDAYQDMQDSIDNMLKDNYGNSEKRINKEDYDYIANPQKQVKEPKIVDPQGIKSKIEKLEGDIEDFEMNVDQALSESNVLTKIEVSE